MMPRKKLPRKKLTIPKPRKQPSWVAMGFDISGSVCAGAAMGWDGVLRKYAGPVFVEHRWKRGDDYLEKLGVLAKPEVFVHELLAKLVMTPELHEIYLCIEEPFPMGMAGKRNSNWMKQQAQLTGAFLGGVSRYGFPHIREINNSAWKKAVADEVGIGMRDPNFKTEGIKAWALAQFTGVPDWPHLIDNKKLGLIPQPESSRAKPLQCDDRYDALGIMAYEMSEVEEEFDAVD